MQTKSWQKELNSQNEKSKIKYKVLLLNQNSLDSYLIEKFLPKEDGYNIFKASSLIEALKILNYVQIDLVIVDDKFEDDIDNILTKLSHLDKNSNRSVMILLSDDYEHSLMDRFSKNIDFVKKPLEKNLFLHRVRLNLFDKKRSFSDTSYFVKSANSKLNEFKEYISIYHNIFQDDEQMMLIFDPKEAIFLEANLAFERNFTNVKFLNKIVKNRKIYREFFPYMDSANYINHYEIDSFLELLEDSLDFNYSLKIKDGFREYSFTTIFKEFYVGAKRYYLIKLIDLYDYVNDSNSDSAKVTLKESNLSSFKDEFISLRELLKKEKLSKNVAIEELIYKISSKLSIVCDDDKIIDDFHSHNLSDIYKLLVDTGVKYSDLKIKINSKDISSLKEDTIHNDFLTKIDEKVFLKFISTLFENSSKDIDILIYKSKDTIIIEYSYSSDDRFIKKDILKEYLDKLNINLEIVNEDGKIIVVINIPKNI